MPQYKTFIPLTKLNNFKIFTMTVSRSGVKLRHIFLLSNTVVVKNELRVWNVTVNNTIRLAILVVCQKRKRASSIFCKTCKQEIISLLFSSCSYCNDVTRILQNNWLNILLPLLTQLLPDISQLFIALYY